MKNLLNKEFRLCASPLTWAMLAASLLTMVPGYPILLGAFFISLGLFHSFQNGRETNDILYSVLLPVPKEDVVRAKFLFCAIIQLLGFLLMVILTVIRMRLLGEAEVYKQNALMNAGPLFLAFVLLIYSAFNTIFLGKYFKTAYKIGVPFLYFGIAAFLLVGIGESLHFFPGLRFLNEPSGERIGLQLLLLLAACVVYALATCLACRSSCRKMEQLDF